MTVSVQNTDRWKWIVLLVLLITGCGLNRSMAQDSTTVICLTEAELRAFHDIYDGRDECYAHFIEMVRISRKWQELYHDLKANHRRLEKLKEQYQLDEVTYEELLQLSAEDMSRLQKSLTKVERKLKSRNGWLYGIGGFALAELVTIIGMVTIK